MSSIHHVRDVRRLSYSYSRMRMLSTFHLDHLVIEKRGQLSEQKLITSWRKSGDTLLGAIIVRVIIRSLLTLSICVCAVIAAWVGIVTCMNSLWNVEVPFLEYPKIAPLHSIFATAEEYYLHAGKALSKSIGPQATSYYLSFLVASILIICVQISFIFNFAQQSGRQKRVRKDKIADPLFENKLSALLLIAGLVVLAPPLLIYKLSPSSKVEKVAAQANAPKTETILKSDIEQRLSNASALRGERHIATCKACHSFSANDPDGIGPNLFGVYERKIGSRPNFFYSPTLKNSNDLWTAEMLDMFLKSPQTAYPGTTMYFSVSNPDQRADIILHLKNNR